MIRIDPRLEASQVWQREFSLEPLDYVIRNRHRMVAAALTLLSGYVAAGMPRMVKGRLASFEEWDDLIRQCVIWLGRLGINNVVDPIKRLNEVAANDPETLRLSTVASTWFAKFSDAPQLLKDAVSDAALHDVLMEVAQDRRGAISVKMLSAYLSRRQGKIVNGYKFERQNGRSKTSLWRVVQLPTSDGGIGGFEGAIFGGVANNKKHSLDNFSRLTETDPSNPPIPPSAVAEFLPRAKHDNSSPQKSS